MGLEFPLAELGALPICAAAARPTAASKQVAMSQVMVIRAARLPGFAVLFSELILLGEVIVLGFCRAGKGL